MIRRIVDEVEYLQFDLLLNCPKVRHGVFLRHGGYSQSEFASLNLSDFDDNVEVVAQNRAKVKKILNTEHLIAAKQCHGKAVMEVASYQQESLAADLLTTRLENMALMVLHADCQAALFYDPVHHALANVHAGWRGSVQNVYGEMIAFMKQRYDTDPADLLVCISPSLGPDAAQFIHYRDELPKSFWSFQVKPDYFNFWEISRAQLLEAGVLGHHIEIAGLCTYSHPADFFSYRYQKRTGRNGTIALLL